MLKNDQGCFAKTEMEPNGRLIIIKKKEFFLYVIANLPEVSELI